MQHEHRQEDDSSHRGRKCWATCAFSLAERKLGNIVMLDIFEGFAKGKALDMSQAAQILNYDGVVKGTSSYEDIEGAEVVVVTSGFPRKPGMTREDLISKNASIISEVGAGIKKYAPDSVVIVVTNPLDLMTYHMWKATGFPHHRVVGQAGILDSARMTHFVADAVGGPTRMCMPWFLGDMETQWYHSRGIQLYQASPLHNYWTLKPLNRSVSEQQVEEGDRQITGTGIRVLRARQCRSCNG